MARTKDAVLAPEQKELMEKEYLDFVKPSTYGNKANPSSCDSLYDDVENPELRGGDDTFFNARSLHVFITRLRRLLAADPSVQIVNARGVGYRLHA